MARSQAPRTTLAQSHFLPEKSFRPARGAGAAVSLGGSSSLPCRVAQIGVTGMLFTPFQGPLEEPR